GKRDHPLAQRRKDNWRQAADAVIGSDPFDKAADIGERLAGGDAQPPGSGAGGGPDAASEASARNLVQIGRLLCQILAPACINRRDRGAEGDALRGERQTRALRYIAEPARDIDAGEAAPVHLSRDIESLPAPPWHGDEADRG